MTFTRAYIPLVSALALLLTGCSNERTERSMAEPPTAVPGAPHGIRLISALPQGEWLLPAGDYANTRFSPLDQINTANARNLRVVTTYSTGIPRGHEGQPLVVNNTMYIVTPFPNNLIALDLTKPGVPLKWVYAPNPNARAVGIACCDVVNRGASYADGRIVYNTLDAHTVAADAASGKETRKSGKPKWAISTSARPPRWRLSS